jgi:hypothetical protein
MVMMITPDSSIRALWQSYQEMHLGQVGEFDEGERILPIQYLKYLKAYLTRRKILTTWDLRLYFPSEGTCAACFIGLKNQSRRPGVNTRPLGPMASTLITAPPRRQDQANTKAA